MSEPIVVMLPGAARLAGPNSKVFSTQARPTSLLQLRGASPDRFQLRFGSQQPALPDKSFLMNEIKEQPKALQRLIDGFSDQFNKLNLPIKPPKKLVLIGEGSSKNAPDVAAEYIGMFTGLPVQAYVPAMYEHHFPLQAQYQDSQTSPVMTEGLFLAFSQSGKSASTLRALAPLADYYKSAQAPLPLVSITNNADAQMAKLYGNHIYLGAGDENSIAATKSMTSTILGGLLFGLFYGAKLGRQVSQETINEITQLPKKLEDFLNDPQVHSALASSTKNLAKYDNFVLLSNGPLTQVLPEAGLKMTETSSNIVQSYNTESFKHGPKVILDKKPAAIYIIPPKLSGKDAATFFDDAKEHFRRGATGSFDKSNAYFVRFENSPEIPGDVREYFDLKGERVLTLPATASFEKPIESLFLGIISAQLLSYYLAEAKGVNPNHPALSKVVTR